MGDDYEKILRDLLSEISHSLSEESSKTKNRIRAIRSSYLHSMERVKSLESRDNKL